MKKKVLELNIGDELILVNPKTKKGVYSITNLTGDNISVSKIKEDINEYYSIQKIDFETIKCLCYLVDFENNASHEALSKEMYKSFNKILDLFFEKMFGKNYKSEEDVLEHEYQCIVKYEK